MYFAARESIALTWIVGAGMGISFVLVTPKIKTTPIAAAVAAFALGALAYRFHRLDLTPPFRFLDLQFILLTLLLFGSLLVLANCAPIARALLATKVLWKPLAAISFSLYLTHHTILNAYTAIFGIDGWLEVAVVCTLSIVVAAAFTWAFDRHHKTVAGWIKARRAPSPIPVPVAD